MKTTYKSKFLESADNKTLSSISNDEIINIKTIHFRGIKQNSFLKQKKKMPQTKIVKNIAKKKKIIKHKKKYNVKKNILKINFLYLYKKNIFHSLKNSHQIYKDLSSIIKGF